MLSRWKIILNAKLVLKIPLMEVFLPNQLLLEITMACMFKDVSILVDFLLFYWSMSRLVKRLILECNFQREMIVLILLAHLIIMLNIIGKTKESLKTKSKLIIWISHSNRGRRLL